MDKDKERDIDKNKERDVEMPKVASREAWLRARKELLMKEKEWNRQRDALSAERRKLPMVRIEKDYVFEGPREMPGLSVFLRDGDRLFHTYSTYTRGLDQFLNTYNFLDHTPLGRQEDGRPMSCGATTTRLAAGESSMDSLEGRRILVTGGSRGLGLGIVEALVERKAQIAVVARDCERLGEVARRLSVSAIPGARR